MRRLPPVHPLALAIYPVVFLYGENLGEASPSDLVLPLAIVVVGTLGLYGLLRLVLRSAGRAALAASILVVAGLEYGRIETALEHTPISGGRFLVALAVLTGRNVERRPWLGRRLVRRWGRGYGFARPQLGIALPFVSPAALSPEK